MPSPYTNLPEHRPDVLAKDSQNFVSVEIGDKVSVTSWGERLTGKIISISKTRPGVAFVRIDGTQKVRWFHLESLTLIEDGNNAH